MSREERVAKVNAAIIHMNARPMFSDGYKAGQRDLKLVYQGYTMGGEPCIRTESVYVVDGSYFQHVRKHPWGSNQEQALAILATWIRTGKMPLTVADWERWCGPPVMLGNPEFLAAIKSEIYKRYWLSFVQPKEDDCPLTYPPSDHILGWWCSGYDSDDNAIICALVSASSPAEAKQAALDEWPELKQWRFFDEKPADWVPGDRFPLADWMRARVAPTVAQNATVAEDANA